jgi:uncharacterized coiled-coil protein SlyX
VDKQDYIKENNKIQEQTAKSFNALKVDDPKSIDTATKELDSAIAKLDALDVPTDYKEEHKDMISALKELSAVLTEIKAAVAAKDPSKLTELTTRMNAAQTKFTGAVNAMNKDLA